MSIVKKASALAEPILERGQRVPRLLARVSIGLMFFGGGLKNKLLNLEEFTAYFVSLGIPAASIQAPMVACIEVLGGLMLMCGFATRFVAMTLSGLMVVAIGTAAIHDHGVVAAFDRGLVDGVLQFVYMPEWFLLLMLSWFVFEGAGSPWSADEYLRKQSRDLAG